MAPNISIDIGKINICLLDLVTHKHSVSYYLFKYTFVTFRSVLLFSSCNLPISYSALAQEFCIFSTLNMVYLLLFFLARQCMNVCVCVCVILILQMNFTSCLCIKIIEQIFPFILFGFSKYISISSVKRDRIFLSLPFQFLSP